MARTTIIITQGQTVQLQGNTANASYARDGVNLVVTEGDNSVEYKNFFAQGEDKPLPNLVLPDGTTISGKDFLQAQNPDLDLKTAAGGQGAASASSSGAGSYADDSGALLDGVERLGSLGTSTWETGREVIPTPLPLNPLLAAAAPDGGTSIVTPPTTENGHYHSRAIMGGNAANARITILVQDEHGNPIINPGAIEFTYTDGSFFNPPHYDPLTGKLTITLTPAGMQAREDGIFFDDRLAVTVNGEKYDVYVVSPDNDSYGSTAHNPFPGESPLSEWYTASGLVRDTNITLGGAVSNDVLIESTEQAVYGSLSANNGSTTEEFEAFVAVSNTTIDAGANSAVTIISSNNVAGDTTSDRYAIGIFGKETTDTTTVTAESISVSADIATANGFQGGTPGGSYVPFPHDDRVSGILNNQSTVTLTAKDIDISATGTISSTSVFGNKMNATGIVSGWAGDELLADNPTTAPEKTGQVTLQGEANTANTIAVNATINISEDSNILYHRGYNATGIKTEWGTTTLNGGNMDDTFIIDANIIGGLGGSNGDHLEAAGIYADNGSFDDENTEYSSTIVINGGNGYDALTINADINLTPSTNPNHESTQRATGVSLTNAEMSITNVENINIGANIQNRISNDGDTWNVNRFKTTGVKLEDAKLDITNNDSMNITVSTQGVGITTERGSELNIAAAQDITLNITGESIGIATASTERAASTTHITAGGDLTMDITVVHTDKTDSIDGTWNNDSVIGLCTLGMNGVETVINSTGTMNLHVSATDSTDNTNIHAYSIYTGAGYHGFSTSNGENNPAPPLGDEKEASLLIQSGDGHDKIALEGDVYAVGGKNTIITGDGNDTISILGNIFSDEQQYTELSDDAFGYQQQSTHYIGGKSSIDMGAGSDNFYIKGDISTNGSESSVSITMGEGNDAMTLENTHISGNVTLDGGDGTDSLIYTFDGQNSTLQSLADAAHNHKITGFENLVLDMTNNAGDSIDISTMLDDLRDMHGTEHNNIYIKGDANDSVKIGSEWTNSVPNIEVDGNTYAVYTNGSGEDEQLYIQIGITTTFG